MFFHQPWKASSLQPSHPLSLLLSLLIKIQCALKAQFKQHLCLKLSLILQVKINGSFLLLLHCSGLSIIKLDFYLIAASCLHTHFLIGLKASPR